jgi:hypothetical protein
MNSSRLASGLVVAVALSVAAAGCGGSGTTTTTTSAAGGPTSAQTLAYTRCMRSHGVPTFPDPVSGGEIPKQQVVTARKSNPTVFDSADRVCRPLLPSGGNGETQAEITQDWVSFRKFAKCMRADGVPNWPDPTSRSPTDPRPAFAITAVGLDGNSPQLRAKAHHCASQANIPGLPAAH